MEFLVEIITGADTGKAVRVGEKPLLIGRSDTAGIRLTDESVSWEHATVRVVDGKLFIENLSALGTKLRGQKLAGQTRLGLEDEVELSPQCRLKVQPLEAASGGGLSLMTILLLAIVVLLLGGGVTTFVAMQNQGPPPIVATDENWSNAARELEQRLDQWVKSGKVPAKALAVFQDAIRLERAGDTRTAAVRWRALSTALLTLPAPDAVDGRPTFAENYSGNARSLSVLMGLPGAGSVTDERWRSDRSFADAFVRFVNRRAELNEGS
ncbi:MAG: FHA domain-containing protein [Phycisphaerales bacterium]|nr:FHA domain-containing protein [Phycisphaerales bacterium]